MIKETLIRGIKTTIPLALTFLIIVWTVHAIESFFKSILEPILPFYFPGLGAILGIVFFFLIGLLINAWMVKAVWNWAEGLVARIPLVKTIYSSIQEVVQMVDKNKTDLGAPVMVEFQGIKLLGFITVSDLSSIFNHEEDIAVYMPMSYQIGGYTIILPRSRVTPLAMTTQETMKFVLTAGLTAKKKDEEIALRDSPDSKGL